MAKALFLGGAFFIGRSYQWHKTSLIRNAFCVWALGLSGREKGSKEVEDTGWSARFDLARS